jgi:hypothetical protein
MLIHGKQNNDPPCADCKPFCDEENEEAINIYLLARDQVISIGESVVAINVLAVKYFMELHEVKDHKRCLHRVRRAFQHYVTKFLYAEKKQEIPET